MDYKNILEGTRPFFQGLPSSRDNHHPHPHHHPSSYESSSHLVQQSQFHLHHHPYQAQISQAQPQLSQHQHQVHQQPQVVGGKGVSSGGGGGSNSSGNSAVVTNNTSSSGGGGGSSGSASASLGDSSAYEGQKGRTSRGVGVLNNDNVKKGDSQQHGELVSHPLQNVLGSTLLPHSSAHAHPFYYHHQHHPPPPAPLPPSPHHHPQSLSSGPNLNSSLHLSTSQLESKSSKGSKYEEGLGATLSQMYTTRGASPLHKPPPPPPPPPQIPHVNPHVAVASNQNSRASTPRARGTAAAAAGVDFVDLSPTTPSKPPTSTASSKSASKSSAPGMQNGQTRRESPLDLSVKTVRQSADSSTADSSSSTQLPNRSSGASTPIMGNTLRENVSSVISAVANSTTNLGNGNGSTGGNSITNHNSTSASNGSSSTSNINSSNPSTSLDGHVSGRLSQPHHVEHEKQPPPLYQSRRQESPSSSQQRGQSVADISIPTPYGPGGIYHPRVTPPPHHPHYPAQVKGYPGTNHQAHPQLPDKFNVPSQPLQHQYSFTPYATSNPSVSIKQGTASTPNNVAGSAPTPPAAGTMSIGSEDASKSASVPAYNNTSRSMPVSYPPAAIPNQHQPHGTSQHMYPGNYYPTQGHPSFPYYNHHPHNQSQAQQYQRIQTPNSSSQNSASSSLPSQPTQAQSSSQSSSNSNSNSNHSLQPPSKASPQAVHSPYMHPSKQVTNVPYPQQTNYYSPHPGLHHHHPQYYVAPSSQQPQQSNASNPTSGPHPLNSSSAGPTPPLAKHSPAPSHPPSSHPPHSYYYPHHQQSYSGVHLSYPTYTPSHNHANNQSRLQPQPTTPAGVYPATHPPQGHQNSYQSHPGLMHSGGANVPPSHTPMSKTMSKQHTDENNSNGSSHLVNSSKSMGASKKEESSSAKSGKLGKVKSLKPSSKDPNSKSHDQAILNNGKESREDILNMLKNSVQSRISEKSSDSKEAQQLNHHQTWSFHGKKYNFNSSVQPHNSQYKSYSLGQNVSSAFGGVKTSSSVSNHYSSNQSQLNNGFEGSTGANGSYQGQLIGKCSSNSHGFSNQSSEHYGSTTGASQTSKEADYANSTANNLDPLSRIRTKAEKKQVFPNLLSQIEQENIKKEAERNEQFLKQQKLHMQQQQIQEQRMQKESGKATSVFDFQDDEEETTSTSPKIKIPVPPVSSAKKSPPKPRSQNKKENSNTAKKSKKILHHPPPEYQCYLDSLKNSALNKKNAQVPASSDVTAKSKENDKSKGVESDQGPPASPEQTPHSSNSMTRVAANVAATESIDAFWSVCENFLNVLESNPTTIKSKRGGLWQKLKNKNKGLSTEDNAVPGSSKPSLAKRRLRKNSSDEDSDFEVDKSEDEDEDDEEDELDDDDESSNSEDDSRSESVTDEDSLPRKKRKTEENGSSNDINSTKSFKQDKINSLSDDEVNSESEIRNKKKPSKGSKRNVNKRVIQSDDDDEDDSSSASFIRSDQKRCDTKMNASSKRGRKSGQNLEEGSRRKRKAVLKAKKKIKATGLIFSGEDDEDDENNNNDDDSTVDEFSSNSTDTNSEESTSSNEGLSMDDSDSEKCKRKTRGASRNADDSSSNRKSRQSRRKRNLRRHSRKNSSEDEIGDDDDDSEFEVGTKSTRKSKRRKSSKASKAASEDGEDDDDEEKSETVNKESSNRSRKNRIANNSGKKKVNSSDSKSNNIVSNDGCKVRKLPKRNCTPNSKKGNLKQESDESDVAKGKGARNGKQEGEGEGSSGEEWVTHRELSKKKQRMEFGDGSDFQRPGWEEELIDFKKKLRMPSKLIQVAKPSSLSCSPNRNDGAAPPSPKSEGTIVKDNSSGTPKSKKKGTKKALTKEENEKTPTKTTNGISNSASKSSSTVSSVSGAVKSSKKSVGKKDSLALANSVSLKLQQRSDSVDMEEPDIEKAVEKMKSITKRENGKVVGGNSKTADVPTQLLPTPGADGTKFHKKMSIKSVFGVDPSTCSSSSVSASQVVKEEPDSRGGSSSSIGTSVIKPCSSFSSEPSQSQTPPSGTTPTPKKAMRRNKFKSGFDYMRKRKKASTSNTDGNSTAPTPKKVKVSMEPKNMTEDDIQAEIRGWVLNKSLGETILHKAARLGYPDVAAYCLEHSICSPQCKDNAGYSPLHEASMRGNLDVAKVLLAYGANPSQGAPGGIRPLHEACENGHVELVRLLISYGADPLLETYARQTPLELAENHPRVRRLLQQHINDVNGKEEVPWEFKGSGPWAEAGEENGFDVMANAPPTPTHPGQDGDFYDGGFEFEASDNLLPVLYKLKDEESYYVLLNDLLNYIGQAKDKFIKCHPQAQMVELNANDFLEQTHCCHLLGEKFTLNSSSDLLTLIKYDDWVKKLLSIESTIIK